MDLFRKWERIHCQVTKKEVRKKENKERSRPKITCMEGIGRMKEETGLTRQRKPTKEDNWKHLNVFRKM